MKRHSIGKKNIMLGVVALVLVMMLVVGVSYSWIEDLKLVQFNSTANGNNTPLKTGYEVNSTFNITSDNNTIDLGQLVQNDVLQHNGYFYESGDMHLSGCYSDGKHFYFAKKAVNGNASQAPNYRLGGKDDENVNYISFTFKAICEDSNVDLWFKEAPYIKSGGNALANARFAIVVDGITKVYSSDGTCNTVSGINAASTTTVTSVRDYDDYVFDDTAATMANAENVLFSLKKGKASEVTVKIWLEGTIDTSISATDIKVKFSTSRNMTHKINMRDLSSSKGGSSWLGSNNMFLAIPAAKVNDTYEIGVSYWPLKTKTVDGATIYYPVASTESTTEVEIPAIYNGEKVFFLRCDGAWDTIRKGTNINTSNNSGPVEGYDAGVNAWNFWSTYIPRNISSTLYTIYGNSFDNIAAKRVGGTETYKGNGTWSDVIEITIHDPNGQVPGSGKTQQFYIYDYTHYATTGEMGFQEMKWSSSTWKAYIPSNSFRLQLMYYDGTNTFKWAYKSDVMKSQVRPTDSVQYRILRKDGNKGSGYWVQTENNYRVYFINTNKWNEIKSYIWQNTGSTLYEKNGAYPGSSILSNTDGTVTKESSTYNIYYDTIGNALVSGQAKYYNEIIFNDGTNKTGDLTLYPDCYYDVNANTWYEDLYAFTGGSGGGSGGGGGGEEETSSDTDTMGEYNSDSAFFLKVNQTEYKFQKKADTYNQGDTYKLDLNYTAAETKWGTIFKDYTQFSCDTQSQFVSAPYTNGNFGISVQGNNTNSFGLKVAAAGHYILTIKITGVQDGNPNELQIISFLPKAS